MRAKSDLLRNVKGSKRVTRETGGRTRRMPRAERKAQILATAAEFFANHGLTAQTRRLADACGISQRLLYRFFPTKEVLVAEVYRSEILGHFKGHWFAQLQDRTRPMEERLLGFYQEYLATVLTRSWLRLFMYASLADARMAPDYIASIVRQLLETIVTEVAHEQQVELPEEAPVRHEIGWALHGAISHYAIRRHLYGASDDVAEEVVVRMHVRLFLSGFSGMLERSD